MTGLDGLVREHPAGIWRGPGLRRSHADCAAHRAGRVDLIVVVVSAAFVLGRRRWLKRQPGEFAGAIRVSTGDIDGLGAKWKRGSGRWVRDVLVWSKAPLMFRNELIPVDRLCEEHPAHAGGVKRPRRQAAVIEFASGGAQIEVAARAGHRAQVTGPLTADVT